jgi:hypothetical protein
MNTNIIVFGLTRSGLEPKIYRTQGEHAEYYTTDVDFNVYIEYDICYNLHWNICLTSGSADFSLHSICISVAHGPGE